MRPTVNGRALELVLRTFMTISTMIYSTIRCTQRRGRSLEGRPSPGANMFVIAVLSNDVTVSGSSQRSVRAAASVALRLSSLCMQAQGCEPALRTAAMHIAHCGHSGVYVTSADLASMAVGWDTERTLKRHLDFYGK